MVNKEALQIAIDLIKSQIGTLTDLPRELATTVANVYYRFSLKLLEISETKERGGILPDSIKQEIGKKPLSNLFEDFTYSHANILSDVKAIPEFIKGLRNIDKNKQPNLYRYSVDFILDCLKYDVKNAMHKTGIRRMIERKFKKVDEIPDLIDLINAMEKSCKKCALFTEKIIHLTSENKEYVTFFQGSCSMHGEFEQYQEGNLNKVIIDETNEYSKMLEEKANKCSDFIKGTSNIVHIDGSLEKNS